MVPTSLSLAREKKRAASARPQPALGTLLERIKRAVVPRRAYVKNGEMTTGKTASAGTKTTAGWGSIENSGCMDNRWLLRTACLPVAWPNQRGVC